MQFKSNMTVEEEAARCRESAEAVCKRLLRRGDIERAIDIRDDYIPDLDLEKMVEGGRN